MIKNESNTAQLLILDKDGNRLLLDPGEEYHGEEKKVKSKKEKVTLESD